VRSLYPSVSTASHQKMVYDRSVRRGAAEGHGQKYNWKFPRALAHGKRHSAFGPVLRPGFSSPQNRPCFSLRISDGLEGPGPTTMLLDDVVDLPRESYGFGQSDNDLLIMGDVALRERAALAVL